MNQKDIHKLKTIYTTILESKKDSGPPYIRINSQGDKFYYKDKKRTILYREDGPAVEYHNGGKAWYINGKYHRTDGPAIESPYGYKAWYIDDKRHRLDGPAIERTFGINEWYINGVELTEEEFNAYLANKKYKQDMQDIGEEPVTNFSAFE